MLTKNEKIFCFLYLLSLLCSLFFVWHLASKMFAISNEVYELSVAGSINASTAWIVLFIGYVFLLIARVIHRREQKCNRFVAF